MTVTTNRDQIARRYWRAHHELVFIGLHKLMNKSAHDAGGAVPMP